MLNYHSKNKISEVDESVISNKKKKKKIMLLLIVRKE